ncbi:phospholipase D-like domain-containing protein [Nitrosococcus wardiae]|uniref:PLD phosphodiesterase domain-containing protein n=1 Tax=Nitrosococcus wardiae TaxID=1814290 RepID=A0A4P7BY08_9GAMM|nr:phospholipase D-like domain-containing protein [Nitrosococcus wardiae]QBQ54020.1 hypothetical protein E3U44_05505 [Nitrosococcus wardiae]
MIDDRWSVIGTSNFDNRSFIYNDEIDLLIDNSKLASQVRSDFEDDLAESVQLKKEDLNSPLYLNPLSQSAARFVRQFA